MSAPRRAASSASRSAARPCPASAARVHHKAASRSLPSRASSSPRLNVRAVAVARLGRRPVPARGLDHVAARGGERADPHLGPPVPGGRHARTTPRTRGRAARSRRRAAGAGSASRTSCRGQVPVAGSLQSASGPAARPAGRPPRRCRRPRRSAGSAGRVAVAVAQQGEADLERRLGVPGGGGPLVPVQGRPGLARPACRMPRLKAASTLPASAALENHGSAPPRRRAQQQDGERVGGLAVAGVGGAAVPLLGLYGAALLGASSPRL
ncbi:hypothetical protein SVIOM342S_00968 [Streptomyces violaceorubidus]